MNMLFVGIDVSSTSNVVYFMNPDGSKHSSFSVQNKLNGTKMLSKRVVSAMSSDTFSNVIFGLESTSVYGDNPINFRVRIFHYLITIGLSGQMTLGLPTIVPPINNVLIIPMICNPSFINFIILLLWWLQQMLMIQNNCKHRIIYNYRCLPYFDSLIIISIFLYYITIF